MELCTKTCATENITDSETHINTYKIVKCDWNSSYTGGVIIFVHEMIEF